MDHGYKNLSYEQTENVIKEFLKKKINKENLEEEDSKINFEISSLEPNNSYFDLPNNKKSLEDEFFGP